MSKFRKKLARFIQNPDSTHFHAIESILIQLGFQQISTKGSHKKFNHPGIRYSIIFPIHNNKSKNVYKKIAAEVIKKYFHV